MSKTEPANTATDAPQVVPAVGALLERGVRPLAWIRLCSDGTYEGPIADCDARMDGVRRTCGAWTPLYPPEAISEERERHGAVPDVWLVKVRRLVEGFEHVSGLARLWEPDYSTGSERALWARATEACADVATLLRDVGKA